MKMAENFARCSKCGDGWFEKKEFVLVHKDSPVMLEPLIIQKDIEYRCVGCGNIQYNELIKE